jgi:hypothetical protein
MDTFNSLSNRLEKHEGNFNNLVDKVKNLEITQSEQIRRIKHLEDSKNQSENQNIELQHVRSFLFVVHCALDFYQSV